MNDRYPTFPTAEFEQRRSRVREVMGEHDLDVLLIHGSTMRGHHHVQYLSNYRGHGSSYLVFFREPSEDPTLYFGISNHGQYAQDLSVVDDVRWGTYPMPRAIVKRIRSGDTRDRRIGLVGISSRHDDLIPHGHYETFDDQLRGELVDVTEDFEQLRYVKSSSEIEWIEKGAELTDHGLRALVEAIDPGVREHELRAAFEAAVLAEGGEARTSFISSAPMRDPAPGECLPWREASRRTIDAGDVVTTELSAAYGGYMGQVHRPIAVDSPPTDRYLDLFAVAEDAYENMVAALEPGNTASDIADAVHPIEQSEFKLYDVNLHGIGTTLHPPFIGTESPASKYWPAEDSPVTAGWTFEENQVIVVQPNVVTEDERWGLQLGTTVVIRSDGPEVIQEFPVEFLQA